MRKELLLGLLFVAAILAVCARSEHQRRTIGDFSLPPGGTYTNEEHLVGKNLMPDNAGKTFRDVAPVNIVAPAFLTYQILASESGGYYLNSSWQERSTIKYRLTAAPEAPAGRYTMTIEFPSGYIQTLDFSVR